VHGIPGPRVLKAGDIVSVDCGAIVDGWHGDAAFSLVLPEADPDDVVLVDMTERALWAGIAALATGERLGAVGDAVQGVVEESGASYGIVREYVGHGIGTAMHQPPEVLNYRARDKGPRLRPGLCVAIEPMVTRGSRITRVLADDWTVVTTDGSRAAHWEHTVAIRDEGIWVLTAPDGGAERLAQLGVSTAPMA
jgi:methionyl aminopeptidase